MREGAQDLMLVMVGLMSCCSRGAVEIGAVSVLALGVGLSPIPGLSPPLV